MNDRPTDDDSSENILDRMVIAKARLEDRLGAAGASPGAVKVVAVSKTRSVLEVRAAAAAGLTLFGESYAAELAVKAPDVSEPVEWHFIGQLQTNKVRVVAPLVTVYQSVDRTSLVDEIAKRAAGARVMVQVNLAGTPGRGGASWSDAPALIEAARGAGLQPIGVMGVAPMAEDSTVAAAFGRLRALADAEGLAECSMGMSADLEIAVAQGSTMIRVGTALFGSRP